MIVRNCTPAEALGVECCHRVLICVIYSRPPELVISTKCMYRLHLEAVHALILTKRGLFALSRLHRMCIIP